MSIDKPAVPDFVNYRRPGIYVVLLTEDGFGAFEIEQGGWVWDDDTGHAYPDLARDAEMIRANHEAYMEMIVAADEAEA